MHDEKKKYFEITWGKILTIASSIVSAIIIFYTVERVHARLDLRDAKFITADRNEKKEIKEAYQKERTQLLRILRHCEMVKTCQLPNDLAVAAPEIQMLPETLLMIEADKNARKEGE
jgi:hypothetical protein